MQTRMFERLCRAFAAVTVLCLGVAPAFAAPHEELLGKSIAELRRDLDAGAVTSEALVRAYIERIEAIDRNGPAIRSVLAVNPDALAQARALDAERKQRRIRGPLHGIPILIKDNVESADPLPTTAGSLALAKNLTKRDAPIVANLRAAGAIILGKTNLSEWANFRSEHSLSGWSGLGGLTKNPHVLDRSACGSSAGSGAAIAAGLGSGSVGTETDGSITCPSSMNGLVGLKPTLGLLSGQRIVPIAHSQDTAGPMTLTVRDAALMLDAMVGKVPACEPPDTSPSGAGAGAQERPPATNCRRADYVAALSASWLKGKRVGVLRFKPPRQPQMEPVYERALQVIRGAGAELVEIETPEMGPIYEAEDLVLHTEFKVDLNAYLATLPPSVTTRSLEALIEFNEANKRELVLFGQDVFKKANATVADQKYRDALALSKRLAGAEGISRLLKDNNVELLIAPTAGTAWRIDTVNGDQFPGSFSTLPAVSGYPHLTVPMGTLNELPLGISFIGEPWSEDKLLGAGYAFEQSAKVNVKAKFLPSVDEREGLSPQQGLSP